MPANKVATAGLGLWRMFVVFLCCFFVFSIPESAGASILDAQTIFQATSADIADEPQDAESHSEQSAASGDVSPNPASADITSSETMEWGTLSVSLFPERVRTSGARWSVDEGASWKNSGERILIPTGDVLVAFNSIVGWKTPDTIPVRISKESGVNAAATYTPLTGSISIVLDGPSEGRWYIDGRRQHASGALHEGLAPGQYKISFADVQQWIKPEEKTVSVSAGETSTLSASYVRTGSVLVMIDGPAKALWNLGEKSLQSGALLEDLAPGIYTISFSDVDTWEKPGELTVTVLAGETLRASAVYAAKIGGKTGKDSARAEVDNPASATINTGEMAGLDNQKTAAASEENLEKDVIADKHSETDDTGQPPSGDEHPDSEMDSDTDIDTEKEDDKDTEDETEDPIDDADNSLVTNPKPSPEEPPVSETNPVIPPEVVRPTISIPELTSAERAAIVQSIVGQARYLDLGEAHPWHIGTFVPTEGIALRTKSLSINERQVLVDALAPLITEDTEGNDAVPYLLQTASFEVDTGGMDTVGKFLVVRVTFAVSHDELRTVDPKIVGRIDSAVASGKALADALFDELRIFKRIGEGDDARCFDLVEAVRGRGFALNQFFGIQSRDGFFETIAQDKAYTIFFNMLLFDGVTFSPSKLVQPAEGGRFIIFDGLKDGKFSDPLILAAARPRSAPAKDSGGCRAVSGNTGLLLLLFPAAMLLLRRK